MNNPKLLMIEKERRSYINGDTELASFLGEILDYVITLEEEVNRQASVLETIQAACKD
jgi:hypothetical protein